MLTSPVLFLLYYGGIFSLENGYTLFPPSLSSSVPLEYVPCPRVPRLFWGDQLSAAGVSPCGVALLAPPVVSPRPPQPWWNLLPCSSNGRAHCREADDFVVQADNKALIESWSDREGEMQGVWSGKIPKNWGGETCVFSLPRGIIVSSPIQHNKVLLVDFLSR